MPNIVIPNQSDTFLYRNLLYTALTRAKKRCIIIGNPDALDYCKQLMKPRITFLFNEQLEYEYPFLENKLFNMYPNIKTFINNFTSKMALCRILGDIKQTSKILRSCGKDLHKVFNIMKPHYHIVRKYLNKYLLKNPHMFYQLYDYSYNVKEKSLSTSQFFALKNNTDHIKQNKCLIHEKCP
jgi:hypothetical protein